MADKLDRIVAPFTDAQIESLTKWQRWGSARPSCPQHREPDLMAVSANGIRCTADGCTYAQDWAYAFVLKTKYCTKDVPYSKGDPKAYVIHVDAEEVNPEYDGEILSYHCPNCNLDFSVDYRDYR